MKDFSRIDSSTFAAALPEMRAHFEAAAANSGDYAFVYNSIADDLRNAEAQVAAKGVEKSETAINQARYTLVAISEAEDFGALAGDLAAAAAIARSKQNKPAL